MIPEVIGSDDGVSLVASLAQFVMDQNKETLTTKPMTGSGQMDGGAAALCESQTTSERRDGWSMPRS